MAIELFLELSFVLPFLCIVPEILLVSTHRRVADHDRYDKIKAFFFIFFIVLLVYTGESGIIITLFIICIAL
jgi:hypothetical protein